MSSILKLVGLEHKIFKSHYLPFLLIIAIGCVVSYLTEEPFMIVFILTLLAAPIIGTSFSLIEKNHLEHLYGVLPHKKGNLVIAKYLFAVIVCFINLAISSILYLLFCKLLNVSADSMVYMAAVSAGFAVFSLYIGILYPLYFKFQFSKVYIVSNLPLYILTVGCIFIAKKTDVLSTTLPEVINWFEARPYMIPITGAGIGIILLCISCSISTMFWKSRELQG